MPHIILAAIATPGHVFPIITIAKHLVHLGYEVTIFTGLLFQQQIKDAGANFVAFDTDVDVDYRYLEKYFPERAKYPAGNKQTAFALKQFFAPPIPILSRQLMQLISDKQASLLIVDNTFYAVLPLLQKKAELRISTIAIGVTPLLRSSKDSIFWGARFPSTLLPADLDRGQLIGQEMLELIGSVRETFNHALVISGAKPLLIDYNDALMDGVDRYLQLSSSLFELPRHDLPDTFDFIGALPVKVTDSHSKINWLDESLPLIVVTQGTLGNVDFYQLVLPTLHALSNLPVRILAVTGGRDVNLTKEKFSSNVNVVEYVDFEYWLPKATILICSGGYGTVNSAIRHGVPLIVAGVGDGKQEAVARVIWSRCGISLNTDTPSEEQILIAVTEILSTKIWHGYSKLMKESYDSYDALARITHHVGDLIGEGSLP